MRDVNGCSESAPYNGDIEGDLNEQNASTGTFRPCGLQTPTHTQRQAHANKSKSWPPREKRRPSAPLPIRTRPYARRSSFVSPVEPNLLAASTSAPDLTSSFTTRSAEWTVAPAHAAA